jgi:hypothetical protein
MRLHHGGETLHDEQRSGGCSGIRPPTISPSVQVGSVADDVTLLDQLGELPFAVLPYLFEGVLICFD